jgi:hypothetical protein
VPSPHHPTTSTFLTLKLLFDSFYSAVSKRLSTRFRRIASSTKFGGVVGPRTRRTITHQPRTFNPRAHPRQADLQLHELRLGRAIVNKTVALLSPKAAPASSFAFRRPSRPHLALTFASRRPESASHACNNGLQCAGLGSADNWQPWFPIRTTAPPEPSHYVLHALLRLLAARMPLCRLCAGITDMHDHMPVEEVVAHRTYKTSFLASYRRVMWRL